MKKEIEALIASEHGELKMNKFCTLYKATFQHGDKTIETLDADFSFVASTDLTRRIESRDWKGVVEEVRAAQRDAISNLAERIDRDLAAGYLSV